MSGWVYAIRFSNKRAKVGKTNDVTRRVAEHTRNATAHGIKVLDVWRLEVDNPARVEVELRRVAMVAGGSSVYGAGEFFTGLDFALFVETAAALYGGAAATAEVRAVLAGTQADITIPEGFFDPQPSPLSQAA